ncbi:MAG: polysaccharide biosynthesis/export family protein [Polyangiales bacterium]
MVAFGLLPLGPACRPPPSTPDDLAQASTNENTALGPGDGFEVAVFGEAELSHAYRVARDGTIDFPLVGRIEVAGLEPPEVADRIAARLRDERILVRPYVSVTVTEYASKRITVMGAVSQAGQFPISPGLTVVQAISLAGGFTALAARNDTVLTRQNADGQPRRFRIPADEISRGRAQDVPIQAGDIIFVPERAF